MRVKAILWTHYKDSNNEYAIKIRVSQKGIKRYYHSGVSVAKNQWNGTRVKPNRTNFSEINNKIVELESSIEKELIKNPDVNVQAVINGDFNNQDFYYYFQKRLDFIEKKFSHMYFNSNKSVLRKLKKYSPNLVLNELTFDFMRSYEKHLMALGNDTNTIHNNFKRIKIVVKELVDMGIILHSKNPFLHFKTTQKRTNKTRLSYADIAKLEAQPQNETLDMYMFSFYCAGIRFGDLCRLKQSNIVEGRLVYTMNKSTVKRSIMLIEPALKILTRYKQKGFIFKQLTFGLNNIDESKTISSRNAQANRELKLICAAAEVSKISFHTSRHSFADLAKNKGMDIHTIKELLGHSKTATTEIYMKSFYKEETDGAMKAIFGDK